MITPASEDSAVRQRPLWWSFGLLAVLAPTLLAVHEPPSVTFYNQALAVLGWGLFVAVLAGLPRAHAQGAAGMALRCLSAVLLIVAAEALGSAFVWGQLPAGLGMMGSGMSLAALLVLWAGWRSACSQDQDAVLEAFFGALTLAGCIGMVLALVQAFHPAWADGLFIAEPTMPGRAVGNLRQPNHFSTLLVFSCCGAAWLGARQRLPAWLASGLVALFIWGIVLTASRTGMIGMAFLTAWGVLDRRLPRLLRVTLVGAPLIYRPSPIGPSPSSTTPTTCLCSGPWNSACPSRCCCWPCACWPSRPCSVACCVTSSMHKGSPPARRWAPAQ
ncbi:MAG: pilin glycosylation ligase domain-containing protein [Aquabacterium sp.]|nr:pilin glycosylation ligase domain-containing protein [Aquabacterium sp.]